MAGRGWLRALAALPLLVAVARAEDFEAAHRVYKEWVRRPSLHKRIVARERLARTRDLRALEILARDYGRPEDPKDHVRYLLAFIATERFDDENSIPLFDAWRGKNDGPADAWLWYLSLGNRVHSAGAAEAMAIARSSRSVFLRAAAIEALRFEAQEDLLPFLAGMERELPSEGFDRGVLLESLTSLLCRRADQAKTPAFAEVAGALIRRMDEAGTADRTRIAMGRHFARLFKTRFVWRNAAPWLQEMEFLARGGKQPSNEGYESPPTFAGIEATGDRICYVIDLSDSMLEPLTPPELEKLPRGPVTGVVRTRKEAKNDAWKKAFEAVRWDQVKNRFDAAREMLKVSLLTLGEDQSYCVIAYGDEAGPLKGMKGLQKATLGNVRGTIQTLDSIRPGPKSDGRPHGTLLGKTNMHGGLHRAFKLKSGTMVGPGEYVNPATFDDGCDTIFLLSDGAPTWDDWAATDSKDQGDQAGDPELGATRPQDSDTLVFPAAYDEAQHVIADVTRLNLFRKVEIHCVGMGGAEMNTLERLAGIGKGEAVDLTQGR